MYLRNLDKVWPCVTFGAEAALGERWGFVSLTRPGRGERFFDNPWATGSWQEAESRRDYPLSPAWRLLPRMGLPAGKRVL